MNDQPHPSGEDRYAVYKVPRARARPGQSNRTRVAETSLGGLGLTLTTLADEGEFVGQRVGVYDRHRRIWIVNPF